MGLDRLRFNASGSDALALVAVRLDAEVGIDVERIRRLPDASALANRLLTADELGELASLPAEQRDLRLFEYWTRKEALAKLIGFGLRHSLDSFSLHPWSVDGARRFAIELDGSTVDSCVMPITAPREGFIAALATAEPVEAVTQWIWAAQASD